MNVPFTSFPLDLRRIARSRAARALVCVLALLLAVTNVMAAAMPLAPHGNGDSKAAVSHASKAHCGDHGAIAVRHAHPGHGADCPCCGKACACMHACDGVVLAMPPALAIPSARLFAIAPPRDGAALEAPLLRPPIA